MYIQIVKIHKNINVSFTGDHATICSRRPSVDASSSHGGVGGDKDKSEDSDVHGGRLSVFIHRHDGQLSHEVIQPLLR